jgi:hypothetical protein
MAELDYRFEKNTAQGNENNYFLRIETNTCSYNLNLLMSRRVYMLQHPKKASKMYKAISE